MSGFDLESGDKKWETLRSGRPVNSSPVLALLMENPRLLLNGNPNVSAYDPVNGKELWTLPGVSGDVAASLAVNSTMVYAVSDYSNLIALKPGKDGSAAWEDNSYTPDVSSPVANDNYLFSPPVMVMPPVIMHRLETPSGHITLKILFMHHR